MLLNCSPSSTEEGPETGIVIDIDGNIYQTVKIGNQWWMAENLRTTKYNDGSLILHLTDIDAWLKDTIGAYCYYNHITNKDSIKKYGALYKWHVVDPSNKKKLAPPGWHVPDSRDWNILKDYLISNGYNWDGTNDSNKIAKALAANTCWKLSDEKGDVGNDQGSNNSSGFSALPGGRYITNDNFYNIYFAAYWWSTTTTAILTSAINYHVTFEREDLDSSYFYKNDGLSVRLVKD